MLFIYCFSFQLFVRRYLSTLALQGMPGLAISIMIIIFWPGTCSHLMPTVLVVVVVVIIIIGLFPIVLYSNFIFIETLKFLWVLVFTAAVRQFNAAQPESERRGKGKARAHFPQEISRYSLLFSNSLAKQLKIVLFCINESQMNTHKIYKELISIFWYNNKSWFIVNINYFFRYFENIYATEIKKGTFS